MTLEEARQHLSAYLDGELAEAARREVEAALAEHAELRADLEALRRTVALVQAMPRVRAPEGLADRVTAALAAPEQAAPAWPWWRPAVLAAAACLVVALLALLVTPPRARDLSKAIGPTAPSHKQALPSPTPTKEEREEGGTAEHLAKRDADLKLGATAPTDGTERKQPAAETPAPTRPPAPGVATRPAEPATAPAPAPEARKDTAFTRHKGAAPPPAVEPPGPMKTEAAKPAIAAPVRAAEEGYLFAYKEADAATALKDLAQRIEGKHDEARARRTLGAAGAAADKAHSEAEPSRAVLVRYADLHRCLTQLTDALREAGVPYALQPLGSGEFVLETSVPDEQADALLARLATSDERAAGEKAREDQLREHGERKTKDTAANAQTGRRVHLVVRFQRAAGEAK